MSLKHIKNWLSEFRSMPESNFAAYGKAIRYDKELIDELYHLFNDAIIQKPCQLLDPVCHQLFNCYKSEISDLHYFAFDFIPTIVWSYFLLFTKSLQSGGIAAFLLGVYNLGLSDLSSGSDFTLPSIFQASIYHEPPLFSAAFLTESALKNRQIGDMVTLIDSPSKKFDSITAHNRGAILSSVIQIYNSDISVTSFRSRKALCLLCSRLSRVGFGDAVEVISPSSEKKFSVIPEVAIENLRILFEAEIMIEVLSGIHFAMFNGLSKLAIQAINDAHFRACYDLNFEIIAMTNAMLNALHVGDFTKNDLSNFDVTASRLQTHPTFIKDAITNASFRARKLPDDIDVQESTEQLQMDSSALSDSFEETHQVQEQEKSPYAKSNKTTTKLIGKKDKTPRMSKSKENEPAVPANNLSARKISTSVSSGNHESSITGGMMLKNIKQNVQEHISSTDVSFKGKSNKVSHSNHDSKNQGSHVTQLVPNNKDSVNDAEFYDVSEVKNCSKNSNLLTEFTFL